MEGHQFQFELVIKRALEWELAALWSIGNDRPFCASKSRHGLAGLTNVETIYFATLGLSPKETQK